MRYLLLCLYCIMGTGVMFTPLKANELVSYGIQEQHGNMVPPVVLLNEDSVEVVLTNLIDKPTILSFVYYNCPGLCNPLLEGIAEVIDRSDAIIGEEYQVITVSIDPDETPSMARSKKKALLSEMETTSAISHWQFLTPVGSTSLNKLSDAMGYYFQRNNNNIIHVAALIVLSPDGTVSQYLYGTFFMPMHWSMAIADAAKGKEVPSRIKNYKYCYNFTKQSNPNVVSIARVFGGTIVLLALGLFIYLSFFSQKHNNIRHDGQ